MSFLKSYYNSVSSFLVGDEEEKIEGDSPKGEVIEECTVKESKSDGWLSGIYNDAYNNSGEVWKAVKTDLTEFASVLSKDAKTVVVKTANGVKYGLVGDDKDSDTVNADHSNSTTSKIKASINRMLEQVSKTLYIPPEDDDDYYYNNDTGSQVTLSRIDARITHLQNDRNTFVVDPSAAELDVDLGDFVIWKEKLNIDDFQATIAELVKQNSQLLDNFTELVPNAVTFEDFWARYFYRVASVKAEESRREALKLRICHEEKIVDNNDPGDWDEANDITEDSSVLQDTSIIQEEEMTKVIEQIAKESISSTNTNPVDQLKITEKYDVILVKHSQESSSASEDNNPIEFSIEQKDIENGNDVGWDDDDIDVDITEEDLEIAKKVSDKDVLESKWDDWS